MRKQLLAVAACLMFSLVTPAFADGPLPPSLRSAGVTQEQWDALQTEVRRAAARANVSERALASVAERLGLALATRGGRVDVSDILGELDQLATRISELEASLAAISRQEDPAIAALVAQARNAIAAGDLDAADGALTEARRARAARNAQLQTELVAGRLEESAIAAAQGEVAFLRREYVRAAAMYDEAAALAPEGSQERYLHTVGAGYSFFYAGLFGQAGAEAELQRQAVDRFDAAYAMPRVVPPEVWRRHRSLRGPALGRLIALNEPDAPARAVAAYEADLTIFTREDDPQSWARTQRGLGVALQAQDAMSAGGDVVALRRAAAAYEAALTVTDPTDSLSPFAARISLGDVLMRLDDRGEAGALERAIAAYREALRAYHLRTVLRVQWANTQMKLGHALRRMGLQRARETDGVGYLEAATAAYDSALEFRVRDADPAAWTDTVYHLALTYRDLGDMRGARAMARNALSGAEQAGDAVLIERARALIAELPAP